jgi:phenylalanyl-tRNA synthetase beta subunit
MDRDSFTPKVKRRRRHAGDFTVKSDRHVQALVKRFRRNVSAVWPYDRADLRINADLLEELQISEGLENRSPQRGRDIDFPGDAILKP